MNKKMDKYYCTKCKYKSDYNDDMSTHVKDYHTPDTQEQEPKECACIVCIDCKHGRNHCKYSEFQPKENEWEQEYKKLWVKNPSKQKDILNFIKEQFISKKELEGVIGREPKKMRQIKLSSNEMYRQGYKQGWNELRHDLKREIEK